MKRSAKKRARCFFPMAISTLPSFVSRKAQPLVSTAWVFRWRGLIPSQKRLSNPAGGNGTDIQPVAGFDIDHEMRDPDGNRIGLCRRAFDASFNKGPVPIRHVALYAGPAKAANFYCAVLGMKEVDRTDRSSIFVSDGYFNLALLYQRAEEKLGVNHFGFRVKSNEEMRSRAEKAGVSRGARRPDRIPFAEYRVHDPEGNGIDISEKGWKA